MKKIYFIFPFRGVGGVPVVFSQLANHISDNKNFKCFLVDYKDGYMATNHISENVTFIEYQDVANFVTLTDDCIAVFQSITPWSMYRGLKFSKNTKIFFWNCHPYNLIPVIPGFKKFMQSNYLFCKIMIRLPLIIFTLKVKKLINLLHNHDAIAFMDQTNYETTTKLLNLKIASPKYISIPYMSDEVTDKKIQQLIKNELKIVWIGRIVSFKYYSLIHFLTNLNAIQSLLNLSISIKIIGSGDYKYKLINESKIFKNLKIEFINEINRNEADNYLKKNANLIIAMGTSALQGASLSIPTILLDIFYKNLPKNYQYCWLHNKDGKCLGEIYLESYPKSKKNNLYNLIIELLDSYSEISKKSYEYYKSYHDVKIVSKKFIAKILNSKCTYDTLKNEGIFSKSPVYSLYYFIRSKMKL